MAKSKNNDQNNDVTYMGKSIDPELQKKVDEYMEVDETEVVAGKTDENAVAEVKPEAAPEVAPVNEVGTAPLLPTEQLPDIAKSKSAKSVQVKDATDETVELPVSTEAVAESEPVPEAETTVENTQGDSSALKAEPEESSQSEAAESVVSPVDAEAIAAPDFAEEPDYENHTVESIQALSMDDPETSQAIDDIIANDADQILGIEDAKKEAASPVIVPQKSGKKEKKDNFFKLWFATPLYRNLTIIVVLALIGVAAAMPSSRYFVLNKSGVRASTSLKVLDEKTDLPLKNVEVSVSGVSAKTDADGNATISGIQLGAQNVVIKKPAFSEVSKTVVFGWGSNPLGEFSLTPVGTQYTFVLNDFVSGKPVQKGEVSYGESTANFNDKGEAVLTVPNVGESEIEIQITSENYRTEKVKVSTDEKKTQNIQLVPAKKHIFVSKRSGKFDLYKAYIDGKNEEVLLAGSGIERQDSLAIAPHPSRDVVAFASSRENVRNQDGYLLTTLLIIDNESKEVTKVGQSERIQIVDWIGDRLVYVKIAQGASEASSDRHRLMSYDISSNTEKELASTNYFNDVLSVNGSIYYSPALYKVNGSVGLYKINADGTNKKTVFQKEVWNLFRTSYDKVSMSVGQDWYELALANDSLAKVGGAPTVLKSRVYVASPDAKQSVWIDERDGKSVLISYLSDTKADKVLQTQSGIKNPVRWLDNDHIVYRVSNGQETADYVLSLSGGEPKKIKDVTNTAGIDRWYYF